MRREAMPPTSFVTFSCHARNHWLASPIVRDQVAVSFAAATAGGSIDLHAWVVMSNHVHVLATDARCAVGPWLSAFRKEFSLSARNALRDELPAEARSGQFWLRGGGHRRLIWSWQEYWQKVHYIHSNPTRAGLCESATGWRWSSAIEYSGQQRAGMPQVADPPEGLVDLLWWRGPSDPFGVDRH